MRRRRGFGRGGPGLLGTMARTAMVAGTASAVAGRVSASQEAAAAREHQAAAAQQQQLKMQEQARIDARVAEAMHRSEPAAAGPARTVDELHAQLTKLGELKQAGLLTDDEFAQQKARLLAT
jgi:Short C-terminal domain